MVGRGDITWGDYRQATRFVPEAQALPGCRCRTGIYMTFAELRLRCGYLFLLYGSPTAVNEASHAERFERRLALRHLISVSAEVVEPRSGSGSRRECPI
jgi:hypothetical protein